MFGSKFAGTWPSGNEFYTSPVDRGGSRIVLFLHDFMSTVLLLNICHMLADVVLQVWRTWVDRELRHPRSFEADGQTASEANADGTEDRQEDARPISQVGSDFARPGHWLIEIQCSSLGCGAD